jgi:hypothetical protein
MQRNYPKMIIGEEMQLSLPLSHHDLSMRTMELIYSNLFIMQCVHSKVRRSLFADTPSTRSLSLSFPLEICINASSPKKREIYDIDKI